MNRQFQSANATLGYQNFLMPAASYRSMMFPHSMHHVNQGNPMFNPMMQMGGGMYGGGGSGSYSRFSHGPGSRQFSMGQYGPNGSSGFGTSMYPGGGHQYSFNNMSMPMGGNAFGGGGFANFGGNAMGGNMSAAPLPVAPNFPAPAFNYAPMGNPGGGGYVPVLFVPPGGGGPAGGPAAGPSTGPGGLEPSAPNMMGMYSGAQYAHLASYRTARMAANPPGIISGAGISGTLQVWPDGSVGPRRPLPAADSTTPGPDGRLPLGAQYAAYNTAEHDEFVRYYAQNAPGWIRRGLARGDRMSGFEGGFRLFRRNAADRQALAAQNQLLEKMMTDRYPNAAERPPVHEFEPIEPSNMASPVVLRYTRDGRQHAISFHASDMVNNQTSDARPLMYGSTNDTNSPTPLRDLRREGIIVRFVYAPWMQGSDRPYCVRLEFQFLRPGTYTVSQRDSGNMPGQGRPTQISTFVSTADVPGVVNLAAENAEKVNKENVAKAVGALREQNENSRRGSFTVNFGDRAARNIQISRGNTPLFTPHPDPRTGILDPATGIRRLDVNGFAFVQDASMGPNEYRIECSMDGLFTVDCVNTAGITVVRRAVRVNMAQADPAMRVRVTPR